MPNKKLDPALRDILVKWHPDPEAAIWDCHGTWVIYHKAVEVMAAKAGIQFAAPTFVDVNMTNKTVVILVSASLGEKSDWATGEVSPLNNKNSYPVAMAEKRARDRVAIKLLGLHGVYSEDEAEDFKRYEETPPPDSMTSMTAGMVTATQKQLDKLVVEIGRTGRSIEKLLKHYGVEHIQNLTSRNATDAVEMLSGLPDKPKAA